MKNLRKSLLFLFIPFIFSCSRSGTKALEKGNYYDAVLQSVEKLKKDRSNEKATQVLVDAYPLASRDFLGDIERSKNMNLPFRWEKILGNYDKLNKMHDLIEGCMACRKAVNAPAYFREMDDAVEKAADERYAFGNSLLKKGTKTSARDAYDQFDKILVYAPNYRDVQDKLEEALSAGSFHVVVEQPKINSRMYQYSNEYFQGKVDEFLRTNRRMNKFIRFYSPAEAKTLNLRPDHVVRLEFVDFVVGETDRQSDKNTVFSKDSVKTGDAMIGGKKVPVFGKVKADITKYRKVVRSKGVLNLEIFDYQRNASLLREDVTGEYTWVNEWARYNGDDRALTDVERQMCNKNEEMPPSRQQLFIEFSKPIYDQVTAKLKKFYDKY